MVIRFERPVSRASFMARRLGLLAFLVFLAAFAAFRIGVLHAPDFVSLTLAAAALATLAAILAIYGLNRLWQVGARGGIAAFWALVFSAVPLGVTGFALAAYWTTPAIFDIASDMADPPPFLEKSKADQQWLPRSLTPAAKADAAETYADLVGKRFDGAPDRVAAAVRKAARASRIFIIAMEGEQAPVADVPPQGDGKSTAAGGVPIPLPRPEPQLLSTPPVLHGKPGDVLFQGQTRTLVFGLPFDVVIRLREEGESTLVDVRATARYGNSDFGIGAGIIRSFLDALESEILAAG